MYEFDYQSERHCAKTDGAKSSLQEDGRLTECDVLIFKKVLVNAAFLLKLPIFAVNNCFNQ